MRWKFLVTMVGVILTVVVIWWQYAAIATRLQEYIRPLEEKPVPILQLTSRPYRVNVTAVGELTGLESVPVTAPMTRIRPLKVAWLEKEGTLVKAGATLIRFDDSAAADTLEKNENQVSTYDHRIEKASEDSGTEAEVLSLDYRGAQLDMNHARRQIRRDQDIFSRWEIQESLVNAALADYRMEVIDQKRELTAEQSNADIQILTIDRRKADFEVENAKETLSKLLVKAPVDGVVIYRSSWWSRLEVGAAVWPGQCLMNIARLFQFKGKAFIAESDISGITEGYPVSLILDAFPEQNFTGSVKKTAQAPQQISRQDPRRYFECELTLQLDPQWLTRLKPGMRFSSSIEVARYEQAMVVPKSAVFKKEDRHVVFVRKNGAVYTGDPKDIYKQKNVEILDGNHGFYVVRGLEDHCVVALRNPIKEQELHLPDFNAATAQSATRRFVVVY